MLVNGRAAMVRRAIASFRAQTYEAKRLLVWDSSPGMTCCNQLERDGAYHVPAESLATIGALRNAANGFWTEFPLIAHWDSDDYSHPQRLAEQVALLEASGKACVGYRELLFWDTRWMDPQPPTAPRNEAWLYRNPDPRYVCGASMLYTRAAWEACPFEDAAHEDRRWWLRNAAKCAGISAISRQGYVDGESVYIGTPPQPKPDGPRMVCGIHGANTENYSREDSFPGAGDGMLSGGAGAWKRAPEWDSYCAGAMKL
jgi:hypothetical protein